MRENIMDLVLDRVNGEVTGFMSHIQKEYGNVKPFNREPTKPVDVLYLYDRLMLPENLEIRMQLAQKYGPEVFNEFEKIALQNRKARGI